jgi:hypothetical protein
MHFIEDYLKKYPQRVLDIEVDFEEEFGEFQVSIVLGVETIAVGFGYSMNEALDDIDMEFSAEHFD